MLAVTATAINPTDPLAGLTVGETDEPTVPDGWEVVEVRAATLNHHDLWTLRGVGMDEERLPIVLGCDAAGVAADGREVVVHSVIADSSGEEGLVSGSFSLLSEKYDGTFAERVAVPSGNLIDKPAELSFEEAACLPTAWLTAFRMLFTRGELRPGQRVLVQGAGGGVSTAAIVLARAAGVHVTVTSRDADKLARAVELGAHDAVESGARLAQRVHAVIETVGEATWDHSLKSLEPGGTIVVAGATGGHLAVSDLRRVFIRQLRIVGSTMGTRGELAQLVEFLAATGVRPLIDEVRTLDDARAAFEQLASGDVFGKLVLTNA
ncbi:MAG: zinc-binding dehydrogenase [Nitriliruptorales bacterium]|nr:zinc-binding dehydrogenase [Nitriliruptorales bacterium]